VIWASRATPAVLAEPPGWKVVVMPPSARVATPATPNRMRWPTADAAPDLPGCKAPTTDCLSGGTVCVVVDGPPDEADEAGG
jgi:hypothetical protein